MKRLMVACAAVLLLGLGAGAASARCLTYEPARVTLAGTLTSKTVPGPPGYRSIAHGDYPETVFILKLNDPICVSGNPSSQSNRKGHTGVTEIQLLVRNVHPQRFVNKPVRVSGTLSSAHMGSHRTPVVLNVVSLRGI